MEEKKVKQIEIPASLYRNIESRIKDTGFQSVDSYVTYVLRKVLSEDMETESLSEDEENRIRERLKSLGYLE